MGIESANPFLGLRVTCLNFTKISDSFWDIDFKMKWKANFPR